MSKPYFYLIVIFFMTSCGQVNKEKTIESVDWSVYLGGPDSNQFSSLKQINKQNVNKLKLAWRYDSGSEEASNWSQIQCNPIIVEGVLFGTSPELMLFAINAETGELIWEFNPDVNEEFSAHVNRGVSYWQEGDDKRLFFSAGSNLFAINANTGESITSFGVDGIVSLKTGLGERSQDSYVVARTPGIIYEDYLIIGLSLIHI